MNHTLNLLCLFAIFAIPFSDHVEARRGRIVGGNFATKGQFPYHVAVKFPYSNPCGGSILTERFIIIAAHCLISSDNRFAIGSPVVIAGTIDLLSTSDGKIIAQVDNAYVPKEYNPTLWSVRRDPPGDIAILELKYDLDMNGNRKLGRVKLPQDNGNSYDGKIGVISGFGKTKVRLDFDVKTGKFVENGFENDYRLRFAQANVTSNEDCEKRYGGKTQIPGYELCAALVQRDMFQPEGLCEGDSGGGLIYNMTIIGIVSTSPFGCRENKKPAVYTRITYYLKFINKVIDGEIDDTIRTHSY